MESWISEWLHDLNPKNWFEKHTSINQVVEGLEINKNLSVIIDFKWYQTTSYPSSP